jgi:putative heme-binding domain-containing protein
LAGDPGLRDAAHRMLASRREWAKLMLAVVDRHDIKPRDVADDVVRQLELYGDPAISALVRKHWPPSAARLSAPEKLAELKRIKSRLGGGDPAKGRALFTQRCATCHKLFDEGGAIGPELTGYERSNPDFWLTAILDPSLEIREGFGAYTATLKDGQTLMGLLKRQDANGIEIKDLAGQSHTAKSSDIANLTALPVSLMPEGLLGDLDDAALRDFFSYLMKP